MEDKKKPYQKLWWTIIIVIVIVVILILSAFTPQILEYFYYKEGVCFTRTSFGKEELLSFYGDFLAFVGTVALGGLALWQNTKLSKTNEKLSGENNYYQKITAQNFLPVLKIDDVVVSVNNILSANGHINTSQGTYFLADQHDKVSDVKTGEDVELKIHHIHLNIDINTGKEKEENWYHKWMNFNLQNTSQAIIGEIAIEKIEILGVNAGESSTKSVTCIQKEKQDVNVSTILNQYDKESFSISLYYKNEVYNEYWTHFSGGLHFRIYLTNSTITGIKFSQYIDVRVKANNLLECSYGQIDEISLMEV